MKKYNTYGIIFSPSVQLHLSKEIHRLCIEELFYDPNIELWLNLSNLNAKGINIRGYGVNERQKSLNDRYLQE